LKKYRELKVTNLKQVGCVDDVANSSTNVEYTWKVTKLVNDHSGSTDNMRASLNVVRDQNGNNTVTMALVRNGSDVFYGFGYNSDSPMRVFAAEDDQYVDIYRGGFEAVLTLQNPALTMTLLGGLNRCHWPHKSLEEIPERSGVNYKDFPIHCASCYITKGFIILGATVGGFGVGEVIGLSALGAKAVAGVGAAMAGTINNFIDCAKLCRIEKCNDAADECMDMECRHRNLTPPQLQDCADGCDDRLFRCCGFEGGKCFTTGGPNGDRCNFCRNAPFE
jgi:hypothetical protein